MSEGTNGQDDGRPAEIVPVDEGKLAEKSGAKSPFGTWVFVILIIILAAWPAFKLFNKAASDTIDMSGEDVSAFQAEGDGFRPRLTAPAVPDLEDRVVNVRYRSSGRLAVEEPAGQAPASPAGGGAEQEARSPGYEERSSAGHPGTSRAAGAAPARNGGNTPPNAAAAYGQPASDPVKAREEQSAGYTKGFLTRVMAKTIGNPKNAGAVLSNRNIVKGFMARASVRSATGSLDGLNSYLKTEGPANFLDNRVVKAALGDQAVITAVATSGLVKAMLETPAAKELMRDPKALDRLLDANPQLADMAAKNPEIVKALTGNPEVSRLIGRFKRP